MLRALLLDRDGVINYERADYVKRWEEFEFLPGSLDALRRLAAIGCPIAVVSNQSAVGRGLLTWSQLHAIHACLSAQVAAAGGRIDAFFVCPHHPNDGCGCRKPQPGLLLRAAALFAAAPRSCLLVGDSFTDYQAACAAGCRCLLVRSGRQGDRLFELLKESGVEDPLSLPLLPNLAAVADLVTAQMALSTDADW